MSIADALAATVVVSVLLCGTPASAQTEAGTVPVAEPVAPSDSPPPAADPNTPAPAPPPSTPPTAAPPSATAATTAPPPSPTLTPTPSQPVGPVAGTDSFAGPDTADETRSGEPSSVWYGGPMLIVDGLCLALVGIGAAADSQDAAVTGLAVGITSGLGFHVFEYPSTQKGLAFGKGMLSLAMRAGLGIGGCALGEGCFEQEISDAALLRTTGGLALAALLDDLWLARRSRERAMSSGELGPTVAWGGSTVQLGMAGTW